jgi:hypothetical protein
MTNDVKSNCRSRGPSRIRQRDVRRLVQAAQAAGLSVTAVEWTAEGALRVLTSAPAQPTLAAANSWDSL